MSTRTIIEINHDYVADLIENPPYMETFLRALRGSEIPASLNKLGRPYEFAPGIRVLGQRHHSEPEWKQSTK